MLNCEYLVGIQQVLRLAYLKFRNFGNLEFSPMNTSLRELLFYRKFQSVNYIIHTAFDLFTAKVLAQGYNYGSEYRERKCPIQPKLTRNDKVF